MLDVQRLRDDTPGVQHVIHFNNAGAALMPRPVLDAVMGHLEREAQIGGYEAAAEAGERLEQLYGSLARLVNAAPDEIAVIENGTRAWDMAFYALPLSAGDVILTSETEYAGNYIPYLQRRARDRVDIRVIPNDERGGVSLTALRSMLEDERVRLISLPMLATNGGVIQPVAEIGALARASGVWYLLDAIQTVGQMPIDVQAIGCDMLSATSRKYLRGPRGMGFLYIRGDLCRRLEPPLLDLHAARLVDPQTYRLRDDARRFENWETNVAAKLGMGAAADYALAIGPDAIWARIDSLARLLRVRLAAIDSITVTDSGAPLSGIVTFTMDGLSPAEVQAALARLTPRINVTVSSRSSTILDMTARRLESVVRASVHAFNTEDEIEALVGALGRLA
ncbi:MAG: aminotransferase class V-fold PLP-dependent enzyme [Anaerolineae bacterium]